MIYFGLRGMFRNVFYMVVGFVFGVFLASAGVVHAGVIEEDWPDAIICTQAGNTWTMVNTIHDGSDRYYVAPDPSFAFISMWFDQTSGAFSGDSGETFSAPCNNASLSSIVSAGASVDFGGGATTSPSAAATSTATTTVVVVNPTQDLFTGVVLFFAVMWFIIWFFRRPYDTQ